MVTVLHPYSALGAGIGILADRALGDPPNRFDPVAAYERLAGRSPGGTADATAADRRKGITYAAAGTALGAATGFGLRKLTGRLGASSIAAWSVVRGKSRAQRALDVAGALEAGDAERARITLPKMVHAEAAATPDEELARLAVATVAEEAIDGIVGPALWATVGGAPGILAYKGINALDSVVGHHAESYERAGPLGRVVDGAANLVPALAGAALVALVRPARAGAVWQAMRQDSASHRSRSVGIVEAAFAGALGVQLAPGSEGRPATPSDISAAVVLSRDVSLALAGLCLAFGAAALALRRGSGSGGD